MTIHPKHFHALRQIVPFGIIWLIFALVYAFLEKGFLGDLETYPTTKGIYSFRATLKYAVTGSFFMGLIQGWIEVIWLRNRLRNKALWLKILAKSLFYISFTVFFLAGISFIANSMLLDSSLLDIEVRKMVGIFIGTFAFWSTVIYIAIILVIALVFSEITEYFGQDTFYSFLLGKYHKPNEEIRIFMFLDMKSSTTIAENIGHKRYFELIKQYYSDMTEPILETAGEIYQYVGDEIVVSWLEKKGLRNNNCIECFRKISASINQEKETYLAQFGVVPQFKAGYHIGEVTSGEIGIIKKDIIYTGDVLNTTARIQAECNNYAAKGLISEDLLVKLPIQNDPSFAEIGSLTLRGKQASIKLFRIDY